MCQPHDIRAEAKIKNEIQDIIKKWTIPQPLGAS